jgi:hypothetical protein
MPQYVSETHCEQQRSLQVNQANDCCLVLDDPNLIVLVLALGLVA